MSTMAAINEAPLRVSDGICAERRRIVFAIWHVLAGGHEPSRCDHFRYYERKIE